MQLETAQTVALKALSFILSEEALRDRFLALSGMDADDMRLRIEETDFLTNILDFLMSHEPDLLAFADYAQTKPEEIAMAWRQLGGGVGQEW